MAWFLRNRATDPRQVLRILGELREQLQAALGGDLVSLTAYGEFVKLGHYDTARSHVNLMLVLASTSADVLDRVVGPVSSAERRIRMTLMTLTEEDLVHSCDVFPIKFVDMQEHHRLICGRDVLANLKISDIHLRLRCEQELRNLMIRLRFIYLHRAEKAATLKLALFDSVRHLLQLLTIALTLKTGISPEQHDVILDSAREEFGLDVTALQTVVDLQHGRSSVPKSEVRRIFNDYMEAVHDAVTAVDQLSVAV